MADFLEDLMETNAWNSAAMSRRGSNLILDLFRETMNRLLTVLVKLRRNQSDRDNSNRTKDFLMLTVYSSLNVLQLISLATSYSSSSEEFVFWSILRYTRLEWIAYKTISLWHFIVITQVAVLTQVSVLVVAMMSLKLAPRLHLFAVTSLKAAAQPYFSVVVIPFQMALLTSIKYTFSSKTGVLEFEDLPVASLGVNSGTCPLSLVCFISLLALEYIKLVVNTRIGYSAYTDNEFRCTTSFDALQQLGFCSIVAMYFFSDLIPHFMHRSFIAGVGIYLALKLRKTLPYYKDRMNYLHFALCFLLVWAAAAAHIGDYYGNLTTSFVLLLLVSPLIMLGSLSILEQRISRAEAEAPRLVIGTKKLQEFELCLRIIARSATTPEEQHVIMDHFNNFRARCREVDKMLDICEVYFCIDVLKDNKLAHVKHARLHRPGFNFTAMFYGCCIKEHLQDCKDLGHEQEYLEFKALFDEVKELDQEATMISYRLWYEFTLQLPNSERIDNTMNVIYETANDVRLRYEQIMLKYPDAKDTYKLYHSFITTVFGDAGNSKPATMKQRNSEQLHFFNEACGILLVDASPDNFGRITHANEAAVEIFGVERAMFIGSDLSDYIPAPIQKNHTKKMLNFATNCTNTNIELPFNVFISNGKKYLRDCKIIAKLSTFESRPVFVVSIVDLPVTREVAIVDDQGVIYAHSEFLPKVLDEHQDRLEGRCIEDLLPINFQDFELFKAYEVRKNDTVVKMAAAKLSVHSVSVRLLFFFTDDAEFTRWKLGKHQQDIDDLTKGYQAASETALLSEIQGVTSEKLKKPNFDPNTTVDQIVNRSGGEDHATEHISPPTHHLVPPNELKVGSSSVESTSKELRSQQKLLVKFMTALKVSRIVTTGSALALVLICISMLTYLIVSVQRIDQDFILKLFDNLSYDVLMAGFTSSILTLQHDGAVFYPFDKVQSLLNATSTSLREQLADLQDREEVIRNYGFGELYANDYARSWHLVTGDPEMRLSNLVEVVEGLIYSSAAGATLPLEECFTTNKDLYYAYRNGLGEVFDKVNATSYKFIEKQRDFLDEVEQNLFMMFGVSAAVLLVCFAFVIPSVVYLQTTYDQFWSKVATLQAQRALDLKHEVYRRANSFFDSDVIEELEASYSTDMRKILGSDKTLPLLKIVIWKRIALKLSVFVVLSALLFAIFYQVCFVNVRDSLELYNERVYLASQVKVGALSMTIWTAKNSNGDSIIDSDVPSYLFADSLFRLSDALTRTNEVIQRTYDSKFDKVDFDKIAMLREDFGSTTPIFHFGLNSAIVDLFHMFWAWQDKSIVISNEELEKVIDIGLEFASLQDEVVSSLFDASRTVVSDRIRQAIVITVCYSVGILVLSLFVYRHMYSALADKILRNLSVIRLIL
jgi:PAS domain-containing protein